jgi:(1->4)-alpha-D-glucan 1-alpha-D-glucosylmutase
VSGPRIQLRATYRLQLNSSFGFAAAAALVPYLRDLGVSHLYLSPSLQARPGSEHGYDVIDPRRLSTALGGETEFRALVDTAHGAGMGVVLDIVPNHMATGAGNRYWADPVLRKRFFDIDPVTGRHRRFFDVDDLAGVRQEDPEVFEETHGLVLALVREGLLDGLRIDHPDGLADPAGYLARLRDRGAKRVWVEKILGPDERLRDWPVTGTVGYEFLNDVCALFVDPAGEAPLTALWDQISGDARPFAKIAVEAKLEQSRGTFAPEVERLARELGPDPDTKVGGSRPGTEVGADATSAARATAADRTSAAPATAADANFGDMGPPLGPETPKFAEIVAAVASLPIYRTYVDPDIGRVSDADRQAIASTYAPAWLSETLLLQRPARPEFVTRFQQTTPAIEAKGVEDTAFYRYGRLLALNDVGGDPSRFGIAVNRFHAANAERAERFPLNLLTTQTHDTKRSADVRARLAALASMPEEWAEHVRRWRELTEGLRTDGAPDDLERYFLFQTLLGAWPIEPQRIEEYMQKALREAKRNSSWVQQNHAWEAAVTRFCRALYEDQSFLADFEPFVERVARVGDRIAHGMLVLKLTAPGIPDIYQGDELPYRALVDPDNRREVDWAERQSQLARLMGGGQPNAESYKLWLTARLLTLRIRRPEAFTGAYEPAPAGDRAVAFVRGGAVLVAVATRPGPPRDDLQGPGGRWRDALRGGERSLPPRAPLADVLDEHGIAVFERV